MAGAISRVARQHCGRGGCSIGNTHDSPSSSVACHGDSRTAGLTDAVGGGAGEGDGYDSSERDELGEIHGCEE